MNKQSVFNEKETDRKIRILWTGGWDSTFRILSLANKNIIIEPIYISDNRKSEINELEAIERIKNEMIGSDIMKCELRPLKIIKSSEIPENANISEAFVRVCKKMYMGTQYDWLARLANIYNGLELCIHKDDKAFQVIKEYGNVTKIKENYGVYYLIDSNNSDEDINLVFRNFHFPILDLSKLEMERTAKKEGYLKIMNMTWFCHNPINDQPCGVCNPCKYTIEEGMGHRLPQIAIKRYEFDKRIETFIMPRILRKIRRLFVGY